MIKLDMKYKSGTAFEILCEAVLSGDIEEHAEITQNEAALSLEVSRMPVREALISLEHCGLVERMPGQHVRVASLNHENISSVFRDMTLLEMEIITTLNADELNDLALVENQMDFHRTLREKNNAPLRKKILETITEIYLMFVVENSNNPKDIHNAFKNLLGSIKNNNITEIKSAYESYEKILADEFMNIRKEK
ncbi:MAG: GntR family transcriptional regulator [Synergistaceae bacterium]|nr:GntR family transcriptional regulator [Synergistaceae bacterium]